MPSSRRVRMLTISLIVGLCIILYLSNDSSSQEFYSRTVTALDNKKSSGGESGLRSQEKEPSSNNAAIAGANVQKPLAGKKDKDKQHSEIEVPKKLPTDKPISGKAPSDNRPPEDKLDGEKSVAGRKTMKGVDGKRPRPEKAASSSVGKDRSSDEGKAKSSKTEKTESKETKEEHEVETEMNLILKRGPIIIFSKSYCPYSAKAKRILLEKYSIVPSPYVVELDQHPLGSKLQASLEKMTGRRTVPNILINGKSIGGGDDVEELDTGSTLIDKIKDMAGKRIMEVKLKEEKAAT